jgi:hypothetical protein
MLFLIKQVLTTFRKLFPKGVHRNRAIWLAGIATIVPLTQLFVIRIFSSMIMHGQHESLLHTAFNFCLFFLLFGLSHLATYWQKTYRVKVFNAALSSRGGWRSKMTESWDWALSFETNNLLHTLTQVLVLAVYFIIVYWKAGLVNFILILLTMLFIKNMFKKQVAVQEGFALAQKKKEEITAFARVGSRIKSAEMATLVASAGFVISLAVLLLFTFFDPTFPPADAVLLFLGFRMQNSNMGQTSSSLMRFARAKALSEAPNKYRHLKLDEEDEEEIG